jgi:hypothetical protein
MSQQGKDENISKWREWAASQSDDDFRQMVFNGQLKRSTLTKAVGCGRSAFLQNSTISEELEALENRLRVDGVLPHKTDKALEEEGKPKEYDNTASSSIRDSNRLNALEVENQNLRTSVADLQAKLAVERLKAERHSEQDAVDSEFSVVRRG